MNHVTPYEYILGFASLSALISIIDMIDTLKLIILIFTAIGTIIKLIEQVYKSRESLSHFIGLVKKSSITIWKKIRSQK